MKKIAAALLLAMAATTSTFATNNGWWTEKTVRFVDVIDSNLGGICEFQLDDNSIWAFQVNSLKTEKYLDLLSLAVQTGKQVMVNYQPYSTNSNPEISLTYTPLHGATQTKALASGVALWRQ